MNKAILLGNLTKDVELIETTNGNKVAKFTIATQKNFSNKDGEREADFINCQAWNESAKMIEKYFHKGDKILVVGRIENRSYEKDGEKKYVTLVTVENFEFVSVKKKEEKATETSKEVELEPYDETDDPLPF